MHPFIVIGCYEVGPTSNPTSDPMHSRLDSSLEFGRIRPDCCDYLLFIIAFYGITLWENAKIRCIFIDINYPIFVIIILFFLCCRIDLITNINVVITE